MCGLRKLLFLIPQAEKLSELENIVPVTLVVGIVGCLMTKQLCDLLRGIWSYWSLFWGIWKVEHMWIKLVSTV